MTIAGKITGVYGIKGWVKLHSYTDPALNIFKYQPWYSADPQGLADPKPVVIDSYKLHGKGLIAHILGVDTPEIAAGYCQRFIAVDMGTLPLLPEGEYYWEQLKGLHVKSVYGGRMNAPVLLGTIRDLMETGANDVIIVEPTDGSIDKRERLLPYVDAYVLKVDLSAGYMLVDWDPEF